MESKQMMKIEFCIEDQFRTCNCTWIDIESCIYSFIKRKLKSNKSFIKLIGWSNNKLKRQELTKKVLAARLNCIVSL